jgi:hypothetical protein
MLHRCFMSDIYSCIFKYMNKILQLEWANYEILDFETEKSNATLFDIRLHPFNSSWCAWLT